MCQREEAREDGFFLALPFSLILFWRFLYLSQLAMSQETIFDDLYSVDDDGIIQHHPNNKNAARSASSSVPWKQCLKPMNLLLRLSAIDQVLKEGT
jgi:hypothetical protein